MQDMMRELLLFIAGLFLLWVLCSTACELRNYSFGHKFIKSIECKNDYQRLFTLWQRNNDIAWRDTGRITNIGKLMIDFISITGVVVVPFCVFTYLSNKMLAAHVYELWVYGCGYLCMISFFLQGIDSLINRIFYYDSFL